MNLYLPAIRLLLLLLLLVLLVLPLLFTSGRPSVILAATQTTSPIKIGVSLGLTGSYAQMAKDQKNAFEMAIEEINQEGGLLGRRLELTVLDDQSDPKVATGIYRRFVSGPDRQDLLFAPFSSEITKEIMPLAEANHYPIIASGAASDELYRAGHRYIFGIFTPASQIARPFLEMLVINGRDNLAIIHSEDPFARELAVGASQWATRLGLNIRFQVSFAKGKADYEQLIAQAGAAGAEVIILGGHLAEAVALRQAQLKATSPPQILYASQGPGNQGFVDLLGDDANGVFGTEQWQNLAGHKTPQSKKFITTYRQRFQSEPSYFSFAAYCSARIMAAAVEKTGTTDGRKLRATLADLDKTTMTGRFRVDEQGRPRQQFTVVTQRQHRKLEVVWPTALMTAKPQL